MTTTTERFTVNCARCRKPIELEWDDGLLPGDFVLIGDWVFHPECWDEQTKDYYPLKTGS